MTTPRRILANFSLIATLATGLALLSACAAPNSVPVASPAGWIPVQTQAFNFYAPADTKTVPVQGIDSLVGRYQSASFSLNFDYGAYSSPLDEFKGKPGYNAHTERIDGKKAKIVTYSSPDAAPFTEGVAIHFPNVAKSGSWQTKLTMVAQCRTKANANQALTLFRTIKFK